VVSAPQISGFEAESMSLPSSQGQERAYGDAISSAIGGKHFVIDTSRNGLGSNGEWCNPPGRALGDRPTASTGDAAADAYFWIKRPGESDGTCNGGPSAGTWWPDYALGLAQRATY
jgi:endoglucanase